jgi:hypothetical protein
MKSAVEKTRRKVGGKSNELTILLLPATTTTRHFCRNEFLNRLLIRDSTDRNFRVWI